MTVSIAMLDDGRARSIREELRKNPVAVWHALLTEFGESRAAIIYDRAVKLSDEYDANLRRAARGEGIKRPTPAERRRTEREGHR